jgi:hypothetical protein
MSGTTLVETTQVGLHNKGKVLSLKQKTRVEESGRIVMETDRVSLYYKGRLLALKHKTKVEVGTLPSV